MPVFYVLIAYSLILFYEGFPLLKERQRKKLIIYLLLLSFSLVISILLALQIKIVSPASIIEKIILYLLELIKGVI